MNGLELTEIVDGAFTDVSLSQDLNLQNNNIRTLQENAFDNLDARDLYVITIMSTNLIDYVQIFLKNHWKLYCIQKNSNKPIGTT